MACILLWSSAVRVHTTSMQSLTSVTYIVSKEIPTLKVLQHHLDCLIQGQTNVSQHQCVPIGKTDVSQCWCVLLRKTNESPGLGLGYMLVHDNLVRKQQSIYTMVLGHISEVTYWCGDISLWGHISVYPLMPVMQTIFSFKSKIKENHKSCMLLANALS